MNDFALPGLMTPSTPRFDALIPPIVITRGVAFLEVWTIPVAVGDPDFTGYTATAEVRGCGGEAAFSIPATFTDVAEATLQLSLSTAATTALVAGAYSCRILLISPGGNPEILIKENPVIVEN